MSPRPPAAPPGVVYLLHGIVGGVRLPAHYLGWTADLDARLAAHRAGRGAVIPREWAARRIAFVVAAVWPGDRRRERRLKRRHQHARLCPLCRPIALAGHALAERRRRRRAAAAVPIAR